MSGFVALFYNTKIVRHVDVKHMFNSIRSKCVFCFQIHIMPKNDKLGTVYKLLIRAILLIDRHWLSMTAEVRCIFLSVKFILFEPQLIIRIKIHNPSALRIVLNEPRIESSNINLIIKHLLPTPLPFLP